MTLEHQSIPPCDFACESHPLLIEGDGDGDAMHDENLLRVGHLDGLPLTFISMFMTFPLLSCGTKGTCPSFSSRATR